MLRKRSCRALGLSGIVVETCSRGHEPHRGKLQMILLLTSQPGPAKPFSAGGQSPPASPWPMQCPGFILQKRSTSFPTGNLQTQLQPKDRRRGCTVCFMGMNNRRPTHCATRKEKKRICRSLRQMRLLLTCFFACYFT